jgi:hypothetical protein
MPPPLAIPDDDDPELGYAAALPQRIGVGIGRNITVEQFDDLWMVRQCPLSGEVWLGSPRETFAQFLAWAVTLGVPFVP